MSVAIGADRAVSIGRVLERTFGVMMRNPIVVFGTALIVTALPKLATNYAIDSVTRGGRPMPGDVFSGIAAAIGFYLITIMLSVVAQGMLARATIVDSEGGKADFGDCFGVGLRLFLPLLLVGLLFTIGLILGFMVLVFPGVLLLVRWAVTGPVVIAEGVGPSRAFGRSSELTEGSRWKIFGLFLILLVILMLVGALQGVAFMLIGFGSMTGISWLLIRAVFGIFTGVLIGVLPGALYVELRAAKEGPATDALGAIFA